MLRPTLRKCVYLGCAIVTGTYLMAMINIQPESSPSELLIMDRADEAKRSVLVLNAPSQTSKPASPSYKAQQPVKVSAKPAVVDDRRHSKPVLNATSQTSKAVSSSQQAQQSVKPVDVEKRRNDIIKLLTLVKDRKIDSGVSILGKRWLEKDFDNLLKDFAPKLCPFCQPRPTASGGKPPKLIDSSHIPEFHANLSSLNVTVVTDGQMNESYFMPRSEVINTLPYEFSLFNKYLCSARGGRKPFLLVFVPSVGDHVETRQVIRETWGSLAYNDGVWGNMAVHETMRLVFLVGNTSLSDESRSKLSQEARGHGDIVLADFLDSYQNLSLKVIIGLQWVNKYCDGVSHVLKADEDTFIHIPKLMSLLKEVEKHYDSFVLGHQHAAYHPEVSREGKWAVGPEYPLKTYPNYIYGHSYVVSRPAIKIILDTYAHMPLVPNEDAYVTGILSKAGNVTRLQYPLFASVYKQIIICYMARGEFVSITNYGTAQLKAIYNDVSNGFCDWRLGTMV